VGIFGEVPGFGVLGFGGVCEICRDFGWFSGLFAIYPRQINQKKVLGAIFLNKCSYIENMRESGVIFCLILG